MAPRRAHQAAIAAGSDGSVLINLVGLLPERLQERLATQLGATQLFVGVPLSEREAHDVVTRLDDAAAEASAHLLGGRKAPPHARTAAKSKKTRKSSKPRVSRGR